MAPDNHAAARAVGGLRRGGCRPGGSARHRAPTTANCRAEPRGSSGGCPRANGPRSPSARECRDRPRGRSGRADPLGGPRWIAALAPWALADSWDPAMAVVEMLPEGRPRGPAASGTSGPQPRPFPSRADAGPNRAAPFARPRAPRTGARGRTGVVGGGVMVRRGPVRPRARISTAGVPSDTPTAFDRPCGARHVPDRAPGPAALRGPWSPGPLVP